MILFFPETYIHQISVSLDERSGSKCTPKGAISPSTPFGSSSGACNASAAISKSCCTSSTSFGRLRARFSHRPTDPEIVPLTLILQLLLCAKRLVEPRSRLHHKKGPCPCGYLESQRLGLRYSSWC